jgi:hypothetical protein
MQMNITVRADPKYRIEYLIFQFRRPNIDIIISTGYSRIICSSEMPEAPAKMGEQLKISNLIILYLPVQQQPNG